MDYKINGDSLSDIADAIREKTESSATMLPSEMPDAIRAIETGGKLQPVIYSLEEREIGVWTDGKPLYRKCIQFTQISNSPAYQWHDVADVSNLNIDTLTNCILYMGGNRPWYEYYTDINNGILKIYSANASWTANFAVLEYTKTTDIPGSGHFVPSGVPAVHYDGNEKIVGTWFGETLYEKTISCGDGGNNTIVLVPHNISNIKRVVKLFGCSEDGDPIPTVNGGSDFIRLSSDPQSIKLKYVDSWTTHTSIYVTIQYTKTS